jgi:hypothetical protein
VSGILAEFTPISPTIGSPQLLQFCGIVDLSLTVHCRIVCGRDSLFGD